MSAHENTLSKLITEKILMVHMGMVFAVCVIFGAMNIFSDSLIIGLLIIGLGLVAAAITVALKSKATITQRAFILSQLQLVIIIVISGAKAELHGMFPLMLASMAIAAIYFDKKSLVTHWIIMDVASVGGFLIYDSAYSGVTPMFVIKGIAAINIGAFLINYMVDCSRKFIDSAQEATKESEELLVKVNEQVGQTEQLMEEQNSVVAEIAKTAHALNESVSIMTGFSSSLTEGAREQEATIEEIAAEIENISVETDKCVAEAEEASAAAMLSTEMLTASNEEVKRMVAAMEEINESSHKIEGIIKAIEDIAFQTNILALNASVEAARAGEAGKGFAVVADEVRNLANKSAEAAKGTSVLIQTSIDAVANGSKLADAIAAKMDGVIESSKKSSEHARLITSIAENQTEYVRSVSGEMETITRVVNQSLKTAEDTASVAQGIYEEITKINMIVEKFEK